MKIKITESSGLRVSGFRFQVSGLPRAERALALVITLILLSVTLVMAIAFLAVSRRERVSVTTSTEITTARLAADSALVAAQAQILANIFATNAALHNYHLLVSTNYINGYGYTRGSSSPTNVNFDFLNLNDPLTTVPWLPSDFVQNCANLLYLPRAPVLVSGSETNGRFFLDLNRNTVFEDTGDAINDVQVNASGNGFTNVTPIPGMVGDPQWVGILERPGTPHAADNKFLSRYAFIALPIGESLDLNAIHNEVLNTALGTSDGYFRNQGVGSWEINLAAFLADLNTNQWNSPTLLNNLNNPYVYQQWLSFPNTGYAFDDARALLAWRYAGFYNNLASASFIFGITPAATLQRNNIDEYGDGPLQTGTPNIDETFKPDPINLPWAGANNPNRYFTPSDFFDATKTGQGVAPAVIAAGNYFSGRLTNASTTITANGARPTYDRYTYYRMLDQLGTDSAPADDRMNLNYDNLDFSGNIVAGQETNLIAWQPLRFFTNAVDRLLMTYTTNWFHSNPSNFLASYYRITGNAANYYWTNAITGVITTNDPTGFGLTNLPFFGMANQIPAFGIGHIPVLVSNKFVYSPSINRLLQLAANIYDASVKNTFKPGGVDYPHVFRPTFLVTNNNGFQDVFINGYEEVVSVSGITDTQLSRPLSISDLVVGRSTQNYPLGVNVYGVPWIIGAKKYLPNFNTFYSYNALQVSRKLKFNRRRDEAWTAATASDFTTNQLFVMSITNHMGFAFWNSYTSNYPGIAPVIFAGDEVTMRLSYNGYNYIASNYFTYSATPATWLGSKWNFKTAPGSRTANAAAFFTGLFDYPFVHEAALNLDQSGVPTGTGFTTPVFNPAVTTLPSFPDFELATTNAFQSFILDDGHVIDYVQLNGPVSVRNLGDELKDPDHLNGVESYSFWSTNNNSDGLNWGVFSQINGSKNGDVNANLWSRNLPGVPSGLSSIPNQATFFDGFFTGTNFSADDGKTYHNTNLQQQAPFTPARSVTTPVIWTVNDPLVHYLSSDLSAPLTGLTNATWIDNDPTVASTLPKPTLSSLAATKPVPKRYQPWGRGGQIDVIAGDTRFTFNLGLKDPLIMGSDYWDFPTNHYPSAGWLGRVHRGTPWQTVYLKATNVVEYTDTTQVDPNLGKNVWLAWIGDSDEFDGVNSRPIQDDLLFDVFTATPHPNATRGALSVNQTHLASWSAVLGGIMALTNITTTPSFSAPPFVTNVVVNPAGLNVVDSPLWQIVNGAAGINTTRANKNIFADGAFKRIGDILRAPALTEKSPFINRNDVNRLNKDITDEQYEWLPQQMLGLLRISAAPRYLVLAYGQTLKPAPGGTVLDSGPYFNLITNYQVVAESATRAVISIQPVVTNSVFGPVTNYVPRVESFNVLPPE